MNWRRPCMLCKDTTVIMRCMQVLDPTSRRQQGGVYRVGPVPVTRVKAITGEEVGEGRVKEKIGGGGGGGGGGGRGRRATTDKTNGTDYIVSEVNSDLRFLRVSKSYASITNQIMSVALVRHSEVGLRLIAGDGSSLDPVEVTTDYKQGPGTLEETPSVLPTRDCSVEVVVEDGGKLGESLELSVSVTNHGHMLRTLDGRVEGHIVR